MGKKKVSKNSNNSNQRTSVVRIWHPQVHVVLRVHTLARMTSLLKG